MNGSGTDSEAFGRAALVEQASIRRFAECYVEQNPYERIAARARGLHDLMAQAEGIIKARRLTQVSAAKVLGVSQSRVSDLTRGKVEKFSLDMLVTFAAKLGKPAKIELGA